MQFILKVERLQKNPKTIKSNAVGHRDAKSHIRQEITFTKKISSYILLYSIYIFCDFQLLCRKNIVF